MVSSKPLGKLWHLAVEVMPMVDKEPRRASALAYVLKYLGSTCFPYQFHCMQLRFVVYVL